MFSPLTSKIFGATTLGLMIAMMIIIFVDAQRAANLEEKIAQRDEVIKDLRLESSTLKTNQATLEQAVTQCSASVALTASKANEAANAGVAALNEARKNVGRVTSAIEAIEAMPAQSCAEAEAILRTGGRP
jgi:uncharacterized protein YlxW (UPF0749 family)